MIKKILYIWIVALCASIGACLQVAATTTQEQAEEGRLKDHLPIEFRFSEKKELKKKLNDLREKGILVMNTKKEPLENRFFMVLPKEKVNEFLERLTKDKSAGKGLRDLEMKDFIELMNLFVRETPYKFRNRVYSNVKGVSFSESSNEAWTDDDDDDKEESFKDYLNFVKGKKVHPNHTMILERRKAASDDTSQQKNIQKPKGIEGESQHSIGTPDQEKSSFLINLTPAQKKGGYLIGGLAVLVVVYLWLGSSNKEANQGKTKKSSKGSKQK